MAENSKEPCWYVIHTYSGYENKVKDTLEKSVENNGMQDLILDVRVPVEEVVDRSLYMGLQHLNVISKNVI